MFSKDIDVLDYAICDRYGLTAETSGMNRMIIKVSNGILYEENFAMNELMITVNQTPGTITFENYEEVKARLQSYTRTFETVDYSVDGIEAATADYNELKKYRDAVAKKKKELEKGYAAPYITVNKMLDELRSIIDVPYKKAKKFVDDEEDAQKRRQVMQVLSGAK